MNRMFFQRVLRLTCGAYASCLLLACGGTGNENEQSSSSIVVSSLASESSSVSSDTQSSSSFSSSAVVQSSSSVSSRQFDTTTPNHYEAPKTEIAPSIDGQVDDIWSIAIWEAIDVPWREDPGVQQFEVPDSPADFTGRYKAIWSDDGTLYLLVEVVDDVLNDAHRNEYDQFHHDDTVEIFIDEDNGREQYQGSTKAFAYHISIYDDVMYSNVNLKNLVNSTMSADGSRYIWEMSIKVVGESFNLYNDEVESHLVDLFPGKTMGFTASYIDNDGGSTRESFIGSVDSELHHRNQGYINSASFGTMTLVE